MHEKQTVWAKNGRTKTRRKDKSRNISRCEVEVVVSVSGDAELIEIIFEVVNQ